MARGIYIGITGWVCDEQRGLELRELLPLIPAEKLLIGTDARSVLLPRDLTPKPSSRRNEPAHLPHILQRIAHWRGEDAAWLAATTDANVKTLFGIAFQSLRNSVFFTLCLISLLIRLSNSMERASPSGSAGENGLKAFERAFGNNHLITRIRGCRIDNVFRFIYR